VPHLLWHKASDSRLIRRTTPSNRLLRFAWECEGPIRTHILKGSRKHTRDSYIHKIIHICFCANIRFR
jgi:hypothetical protein